MCIKSLKGNSKVWRLIDDQQVEQVRQITVVGRDVTKFAFEFDNVRTSHVFSRFEIRRIFSRTRRRIRTSSLHDRRHIVYTHRPPEHELDELM